MSLIDNSENNLVGNPTYTAREIDELRILDTTFEALKPGISEEVIVCYFANFGIVFTSPNVTTAYVKCWCGKQSIVNKDVTWYRYNDVFGLKVNADYKIVYDANVDKNEEAYIQNMPNSEINTVSETSAKFNISNSIPKRAGYKFLCWSEENNTSGKEYKPGEEITLNWKEGYGGTDNPVSKTLYAVWQNDQSTKITIEANKIWEDNNNESGKRPTSIKLQIKRNGIIVEEAEVNEAVSWKHTFELPKYDELGNEIIYTVDEDYESKFYVKNIVENVITNTFAVPEDRVKIVGTKVWQDNDNAGGKRDESVKLQLKNEKDEVISEAEVKDSNNWSFEFEALKYDNLGNEVSYHIDEKDTNNKFYQKELTNSTTVTNRFVVPDEKVLIQAVKSWEDNNNSLGKRPDSVTLQIYNKDIVVAEKKVSESDNWSFEVELLKYDELGEEIEYRVDEKETSKYYEKLVEGNVVINRLMYDLPNTSDINIFMYCLVFFVAIIVVIVGVIYLGRKK